MTTRSTLYRCHLFTFGGPQSTGIESRWTHDLIPIGDAEVLSGEEVELYAKVDAEAQTLTPQSKIRFDILEEDFLLTGGLDDRVVSLVGTGAAVTEPEFPTVERTTVFREIAAGETPHAALDAFRRTTGSYRDQILVLTEKSGSNGDAKPSHYHVVGWWIAERVKDWANSEMYFIAAIDDAEDKSEDTIDVSATPMPTKDTPGMPWTVSSSVRRIHSLLRTGVFDWSVSGKEARAALEILKALRPVTLMEVVAFMKLDETWMKLLRALDKNDPDALIDLQMMLDPNLRFLLPGDTVQLEVFAGTESDPYTSGTFAVRDEGVRILRTLTVPIAGMLPEDAASAIAKALLDGYLKRPTVILAVTGRRHAYLDREPPSGRMTFRSQLPAVDPDSAEYKRDTKMSAFLAYIAPLRNPDPRTTTAAIVYLDWLSAHRDEEAFLTREPDELWSWADQQAAPPPEPPITKFLAFYHSMTAKLDRLPPAERRDRIETASRYMRWLDAHDDDDATLTKTEPVAVWSKFASGVAVERVEEEIRKRETEIRERRHQLDVEAAGKKLDEAIVLVMRDVYRLREPETIDVTSEAYGYLIMPSDFEREVRETIGHAFLSHILHKVGSDELRPQLLRTPISLEFDQWLDASPDLKDAIFYATSHPYVEKYEIEIDEPAWQTAIEIAISFIPIVGNLVQLGEAYTGRSLFGRKLTTVERAIAGAGVFLPFAAKTASAAKGVFTASTIIKEYGLVGREANALYRAAFPVRPGSWGEGVLNKLFGDIQAGRGVRGAADIRDAEKLLREMGMFDRATLRALGIADGSYLRGAELAGVAETEQLLAKAIGGGDLAVAEFRALAPEAKEALRAATKRKPDLLRNAILAESDTGLKRYSDAVVDHLTKSGMPAEQEAALRKAIDTLNFRRRAIVEGGLETSLKEGSDKLLKERLDELAQAAGVRHEGEVWVAQLNKRRDFHIKDGNPERAREIKREMDAIEAWVGKAGDAAADARMAAEAKLLGEVVAGTELALRVRNGAGSTIQHLWARFRLRHMKGPVTAMQAREAFVEYVGHASKNFVGNYGEFEVAFRLGNTHILVKAPDGLVNLPGTDLVAIPRGGGKTLLIDNKALNRDQVDSVTALTRNLTGNFLDDLDEFVKLAGASQVPAELTLTIQRMSRARAELQSAGILALGKDALRDEKIQQQVAGILKKHDIDLVVTNAGGQVTAISDDLANVGLDLVDLNKFAPPATGTP
jgi:hypothetical protein